jgi:universal stress protein A
MKFKRNSKAGGVLVEMQPQELELPSAGPMFSIKTILVPVDFSDCSKKAVQYAVAFAKQFKAKLTLLYVVEPYPAVPEMAPVDFETLQDGKAELKALKEAIGEQARCDTSIRTGTPHVEISATAQELGADLIIISTHGHRGFTRLLLGSTTERVVRYAPCPVLIVKEFEHDFVPGPAACADI